ncbi:MULTISPECIES: MbnP family copper-binding protein [unclassified Marinobacter]|uniref:MbnP family copper-binding protein n=1 Tax=unclassified Marinobacter TaxID=83889 RepID=UPI0026E3ACE8|nr:MULTISPECIES: MbnP family copper-binding protein [unclassified Marinobacter]MDO6441781.1 metallo-mystery pair system four-Cys motif protein [Marinobacter sp. 2_MG-2023]MDO6824834.1 metallo-mystery pair system four-Cys motif protein [Marinobacter sp. 1_MG-2023]
MEKYGIYCLIAGGLLLSGCGGSSSSSSTETEDVTGVTELTIPFKALVGTDPMTCGQTFTGLGLNSTDVTFVDFRVFISNIRLVTDQGEEIPFNLDVDAPGQNAQVALLDFRDTATVNDAGDATDVCVSGTDENPGFKDSLVGTADIDPAKTISHFEFTIGVPFELNHVDQAGAEEPLRNPGLATGMAWSWQNGYKFIGADVVPTYEGGSRWNFHLGSTGCDVGTSELQNGDAPTPCLADNRVDVSLALGGYELGDYAVAIDYAALVSASNLNENEGGAPGCMSFAGDPECPAVFKNLALPFGEEDNADGNPNIEVFKIVELSAP